MWNQYSHRVYAEVTLYIYRFPILFLNVFWEQHLSRFALSLQMTYILIYIKFVAGHGTVVQPVSINIVFGCKQAQQYSRTHQLGFIRAVSWNAQKMLNRIGCTCTYSRTLQFSCISQVWVTARFDVLFKSLNVTETKIFFLHISVFSKS